MAASPIPGGLPVAEKEAGSDVAPKAFGFGSRSPRSGMRRTLDPSLTICGSKLVGLAANSSPQPFDLWRAWDFTLFYHTPRPGP